MKVELSQDERKFVEELLGRNIKGVLGSDYADIFASVDALAVYVRQLLDGEIDSVPTADFERVQKRLAQSDDSDALQISLDYTLLRLVGGASRER